MNWVKSHNYLITSLVIWDHRYEPYQAIIFRLEKGNVMHLIYYVQLDTNVIASTQEIHEFRTNTEAEKMFHVARTGLLVLENALNQTPTDGTSAQAPVLDQLFNDAFMSPYAIALMREKSPDFGFYSFSPNLKKITKMLEGQPYQLLAWLKTLQNKSK